jgi:hypothetical protein
MSVQVQLSGSRFEDARRARTEFRSLTGNPDWTKPLDWVFHHAGEQGTIQLLPLMQHAALPHTCWPALTQPAFQKREPGADPTPLRHGLPAISASKLYAMEEILEINLPSVYRTFLQNWNGGVPRVGGFQTQSGSDETVDCFLGVRTGTDSAHPADLMAFLIEYGERLPEGLFPIAYDPFGNLILLSLEDAGVWFWDHERVENLEPVAPTFEDFLGSFFDLSLDK